MVTTLYPSKDSYTQEANPTTNYGTSTTLYVETTTSGQYRHMFIDFDLSSLDKYEVASSKLSLYSGFSNDDFNLKYSHVTSSWTSGGITWNNEPTYSSVPLGSVFEDGSAVNRTEIPNASYVNDVLNGGSLYGYAFHIAEHVSGVDPLYTTPSVEWFLVSSRPRMEVTTFLDEGYYVSDSVDVSLLGAHTVGNGSILLVNYNVSSGDIRARIQPPWTDVYGSEETWEYNDTQTFTDVKSAYTEYFKVTYIALYLDEVYYATFDYEWYRMYDDVYVSLSGSDSNMGFSWNESFRTMTKGFTDVGTGGTVNVEGGTYTGESSFDVPKECNMELRSGYGDVTLNIN